MAINPLIFLGLGLGALGLVATSSKPATGIVEAKPGETYLLTLRAVGAKVTQEQANSWGQQVASVGKLDSIIVNDSGDTVAAVITYSQPTHIVLNQLVALTTSPDKGLMVTEAVLQPDFSKIPNAPVPSSPAPRTTSPTPSTPAQKPTPAGQPWPWVAASEQMMMQAGNEYEMRNKVQTITLSDLFDQHLNDGTLTSSRLPIVLTAQEKGTLATPLGAMDGVTGIRFRWIGDTGLAPFPSWAVRDMEIRPYIG
jgi:hypothetical protein